MGACTEEFLCVVCVWGGGVCGCGDNLGKNLIES